jgi:hypothetical protein
MFESRFEALLVSAAEPVGIGLKQTCAKEGKTLH